jgi:hypothetical protein
LIQQGEDHPGGQGGMKEGEIAGASQQEDDEDHGQAPEAKASQAELFIILLHNIIEKNEQQLTESNQTFSIPFKT